MLQLKPVKFLFLPIAFALLSCSTIPAQTSEVSQTSEVLTTSTPAQTEMPATEEIPTALKPGNVEALTLEQQLFMDSEYGKAQQAWLTEWIGYWTTAQKPQRVFFPDAPGSETGRVYYKIMTDPRSPKTMTLVLESPDYPGVVMLPPASARENMSPPPEAKPNHEIPTGNGPLQLSTTSRAELTQFGIPEGSSLAFINDEFMMVDQSGKIVGLVDFDSGQWVSADSITSRFVKIADKGQADRCNIRTMDDFRVFRLFAKVVDQSTFPSDVIFEKIRVMMRPGAPWFLDWDGTQATRDMFKGREDKLPFRDSSVVFCRMDVKAISPRLSGAVDVYSMKFVNPSGRISFLNIGMRVGADFLSNTDFPAILVKGTAGGAEYPVNAIEIENLMYDWVSKQEIPRKLETMFLYAF